MSQAVEPAISTHRVLTSIGVIEAAGSLAGGAIFVSGWARHHPVQGAPVLIATTHGPVLGRFWAAWSDRADVGPGAGFSGIIDCTGVVAVEDIVGLRLGSDSGLSLYEALRVVPLPEACALLRQAIASLPRGAGREKLELAASAYDGTDTISISALPIRIGIDDCVALSGGSMLVSGWIFDPERLVSSVHIAGQAAPRRIDGDWIVRARPDVSASFAADARFASYAVDHHSHGFVALAQVSENGAHLTLETEDGAPLHHPLVARRGNDIVLLRKFLRSLDPDHPSSIDIADRLIAPALAALDRRRVPGPVQIDAGQALSIVIGAHGDCADIAGLLAILATDPMASQTPIVVAADARELAGFAGDIERTAQFFGLNVRLAPGNDIHDALDALNHGMAHTQARIVCLLTGNAVPQTSGWLRRLIEAYRVSGEGAVTARISASREDSALASALPTFDCCLIDGAVFSELGGFPGAYLDRSSKAEAFAKSLLSRGIYPTAVPCVEMLTAGNGVPDAWQYLSRRADRRAASLREPAPLQVAQ